MSAWKQFISSLPHAATLHKIIFDQEEKPVDSLFIDINNSFTSLTGLKRADVLNRRVTEVLPGIENDPTDWIDKCGRVAIIGIGMACKSYSIPLRKWIHVIMACPRKGFIIIILEDITDHKRDEEKKEERILELQNIVSNKKQLNGIISICASCKKIHDVTNSVWTPLESYISKNSKLDFSHTLCPQCAMSFYPELSVKK